MERIAALEAENEQLRVQGDAGGSAFATFMDNSPATAFFKDAQGRLLYINQAFIDAFDFADRDWKYKTDFELWDHATASVLRENDLRILNISQQEAVEEDVSQPDGIHNWLTHKFCFRDQQGNKYLGGMGIDLTEQKRKDLLLHEASEQAAATSLEKSQFLSLIIQELRTPIYSIIASSELWSGDHMGFDENELATFIQRGVTKLRSQLENLVLLAETDNDALDVGHFEFELHPLVERLLGYTYGNVAEGVEFSVRYGDVVPRRFIGDSHLIEHMVRTTLENACRFTDQGAITLAIEWDDSSNKLEIVVKDSGSGISYEKRQQIYEDVVRASRSVAHQSEHIGLGLTVGYRLGAILNADMEMWSRGGQGTEIRMSVPLEKVENPLLEKSLAPIGRCSILIVEHDRHAASALRGILEDFGQQVTLARSGNAALDLLSDQVYDLIFMDVQMPIMDGLTTTRWIHQRGVNTPIVAVTNNNDQTSRRRCIQIGMNEILAKPIRRTDLLRILERQKII